MAKEWKGMAADFINATRQMFIGQGGEPEDIFVQDLYTYEPQAAKVPSKKKSNLVVPFQGKNPNDRKVFESLFSIYNQNIATKRELLTQSRKLFDTDIVQTIIDVIIDDGFNAFIDEDNEFKITYKLDEKERTVLGDSYQEQIQNEIDEFVEKFDIKERVQELIPELLRDGEYAWGVLGEEGKGITEIVDDMDVINLLPFYVNNKLAFVMKQEQMSNPIGLKNLIRPQVNSKPTVYNPDNITFFRLKYFQKERINLSTFYDTDFRNEFYERYHVKLPKYVRICKPIYYSALKNLNRLQLMEDVNIVTGLSDILKPEIVSLSVPATATPQEVKQAIRDYERQLNDLGELGANNNWDVASLTAAANKRKILPNFLDGKGVISTTGVSDNTGAKNDAARNMIEFIRGIIAISVGIPPYYLSISTTPEQKAQTIKLYSRYTKKLTSLQKSLADGVKDVILKHLRLKGIVISKNNVEIKFKSIVSGDSLDDADIKVATITGFNDMYKGLEEMCSSEENELSIDSEALLQAYNDWTGKYMNMSDLVYLNKNKFQTEDDERLGGDFEPDSEPAPGERLPSGRTSLVPDEGSETNSAVDNANNAAYDSFVNDSQAVELESPEVISTEVGGEE